MQRPIIRKFQVERHRDVMILVDCGRLIVHGHTPRKDGKPEVRPNRLDLDTAAVLGGPLTAAAFDMSQRGPLDFLTDEQPLLARLAGLFGAGRSS